MDDDEFRRTVLDGLAAIRTTQGEHGARLGTIVVRLDEQDLAIDRLTGKVDRLAILTHAGEEALTSITALTRRVRRLENPEE